MSDVVTPLSSSSPASVAPSQTEWEATLVHVQTQAPKDEEEDRALAQDYQAPFSAVSVDFLEDAVRIHVGLGMTRLVTYEDFLANTASIFGKDNQGKKTVWKLPEGVLYFSTSNNRVEISFYYPECSREISYYDDRKLRRAPNIIITHSLSRKGEVLRLEDSRFYGTKFSRNELSVVFHSLSSHEVGILPFTNVYQDARLCYGSNPISREFKGFDLRPLHAQYELLFSAPFNDDLGLYALKDRSPYRGHHKKWYAELARRAAKNEPFPYSEMAAFGS